MTKQLEFSDERKNITERIATIHQNREPIALLLDGLQDIRNIGGLFRLADAGRFEKIYLSNCTDISHKKFTKVARSTDKYVPFELVTADQFNDLKIKYRCVALEVTSDSIPYTTFKSTAPLLLIIGNERHGVSDFWLRHAHQSVHIPMQGVNTSMNVNVATGIVSFYYLNALSKK